MNRLLSRGITVTIATVGILTMAPGGASAAGPQELPSWACNSGTQTASTHAPSRTSAEAIPHVEHSFPVAVPYCHHFNPTAAPPTAP